MQNVSLGGHAPELDAVGELELLPDLLLRDVVEQDLVKENWSE